MGVAPKTKATKTVSAAKTAKSSLSHPPYIQMITEALTALKERTGSSPYAIAKHIEEEQKIKDLPANFKKVLFVQLKKFAASGKLVKVKNSFKLPAKSSTTAAATTTTEKKVKKPAATTTTTTAKPKVKATKTDKKKDVKTKSLKAVKSPMKKKAVAKVKKPKSIKSPAKKTTAAAVKKAVPAAKKAKK